MKIVLYDEKDGSIAEVIEDVEDPKIQGDEIRWINGSLLGIKLPFLLLDNDVAIGEKVDDSLFKLDRRGEFVNEEEDEKEEIRAENEALKERLQFLEEVTQEIIFSLYG